MNDNIAWAAGLFEGEGTICARGNQNGRLKKYLILAIQMTDLETLERFRQVIGCGYINGPYLSGSQINRSTVWSWRCTKREDVTQVVRKLWPLLSTKRRLQIKRCYDVSTDARRGIVSLV